MSSETTNAPREQAAEISADARLRLDVHEAVERTFAQICDGVPEVSTDGAPLDGEGISATIEYRGALAFTVVLAVPRATAGPLMKTFTGVPIDYDTEVMEDVTGELLNVLAGDLVAELSTHGIEVSMALPSVERTLDPAAPAPGIREVTRLAVRGDSGPFSIVVLAPATGEGDGR